MQLQYLALNKEGQKIKGEIEAENENLAIKSLRQQGLYIINIGNKSTLSFLDFFQKRIPLKEKLIFTQQLSIMIKAGLPLVEALVTLKEQTSNKNLAKILSQIIVDVKGGSALSAALEKYPDIFPKLYVSVVRSGEKSGKLDDVMEKLSEQMIRDYDLIAKVRSALVYPAFILATLIGVIILVLIYVIPQLKKIFEDVEVPLPITTRALLATSSFIRSYFWLIIIFIIALYILMRYLAKKESVGYFIDEVKLKLPIFGTLYKKIYMARFSRTLSTLIAAGLPMLDIFDTVADVINNRVIQKSLKNASKDVEAGVALSTVLKKDHNFSPMISHLVSVGEKSGKLDFVLGGTADFFDKEVENTTKSISSLIEPILMVIMGVGIGIVLSAVIMPIYNLVNVL